MALVASTTGCGTVQGAYKPQSMGLLADSGPVNGIEVTLVPDKATARIGDVVTFSVKIKNVGTQTVWIPREPDILLTWIYPDGKRDNFVNDYASTASTAVDLLAMAPGQEKVFSSAITTYYFNRGGITEFRAKVNMTGRTAQATTASWNHEIASNGFGVMFEN